MKNIGLYIHIPFCKSKCHYCDFNSHAGMEELFPAYFQALEREAASYSEILKDYTVETVFIGGGTPSLVPPFYIQKLMDSFKKQFSVHKGTEISMESNPGTLSREKLENYLAAGTNRLSIGLQAAQNELLQVLGRIHTFEEFLENYRLAQKTGFQNINVDLMFGIPGQTLDQWKESLQKVLELNPAHLSCYSLKIEEDTLFGRKYEKGELTLIPDELDREMYCFAVKKLAQEGYRHYEISNFAREGRECRHNLIYWKAEEYIGLGAGAHSYFKGERYNNLYNTRKYIDCMNTGQKATENEEIITTAESMKEFLILGLRLVDGVCKAEFNARYGEDLFTIFGEKIEKLQKRGLLEFAQGKIRLTSLGLDLANEAFMEFI